ncbi:tRNA (guanine-N(7)-)-methyltransferase non-catalytic subunit trm82 [Coniothyrium glycines]
MPFPIQCLVARPESSLGADDWTLFGASGSNLIVQSCNGATSEWSEQIGQARSQEDEESEGPPGKRIKLEQPKGQKSTFANLILSHDGKYLVGVTGEDKCIRVFQIDAEMQLHQLSERCMSRRPSSITITSDDSTILCADKFGDVYALPLLPSPEDEQSQTQAPDEPKDKEWTPSATTLTVHSGRNRRTLDDQLKQKAKGLAKSKEPMRFKHDLLLGHVSMLTDVVYAKQGSHTFIITADRDEHIRISRGQPQAHIIEGFCFGHTSFISKLCLTPSGLLVSGGGDDDLFVWDWHHYELLTKLPIRQLAYDFANTNPDTRSLGTYATDFKVAVSGIWGGAVQGDVTEILVACESVPALFFYKVGGRSHDGSYVPLQGNPLDVALIRTSPNVSSLVVSVDTVHKPGSSMELRDDHVSPLQCFSKCGADAWVEDTSLRNRLNWFELRGAELPAQASITEVTVDNASGNGTSQRSAEGKTLRDILYSIENLRKRPGAEE